MIKNSEKSIFNQSLEKTFKKSQHSWTSIKKKEARLNKTKQIETPYHDILNSGRTLMKPISSRHSPKGGLKVPIYSSHELVAPYMNQFKEVSEKSNDKEMDLWAGMLFKTKDEETGVNQIASLLISPKELN